jgi:hypothetical protein
MTIYASSMPRKSAIAISRTTPHSPLKTSSPYQRKMQEFVARLRHGPRDWQHDSLCSFTRWARVNSQPPILHLTANGEQNTSTHRGALAGAVDQHKGRLACRAHLLHLVAARAVLAAQRCPDGMVTSRVSHRSQGHHLQPNVVQVPIGSPLPRRITFPQQKAPPAAPHIRCNVAHQDSVPHLSSRPRPARF